MSRTKEAMIENGDFDEVEDDGFVTVDMSRCAIVTNYIHPPIPIRIYDWQATRRDYEPGDEIGYGATEQEAIDDLKDKLAPDEEPCPKCNGEGSVWTHPQDPQDAVEVPCPECKPNAFDCPRCGDTGYTRNVWNRRKEPCPDCWQDNGPTE